MEGLNPWRSLGQPSPVQAEQAFGVFVNHESGEAFGAQGVDGLISALRSPPQTPLSHTGNECCCSYHLSDGVLHHISYPLSYALPNCTSEGGRYSRQISKPLGTLLFRSEYWEMGPFLHDFIRKLHGFTLVSQGSER